MQVSTNSDINEGKQLTELFVSRLKGEFSDAPRISTTSFLGLLEKGVSGAVLKPIVSHIPKVVVVQVVGSDQTNFSKLLRKKRLSFKQTEELNDLTELWQELREFFNGDEEDVVEWINSPAPALEGKKPISLMGGIYGRSKVRECIEVMKYGDFA